MGTDSGDDRQVVFDARATRRKFRMWFSDLTDRESAALITYLSELLRFNKTINLIANSTASNADAVHIGDAVFASRLIAPCIIPGKPVYDFGSGNGIPGLVYALLYKFVLSENVTRIFHFDLDGLADDRIDFDVDTETA